MRVLILDDQVAYADLVASVCRKLGHEGIVKIDPKEALLHLRGEHVADALLIDLDMPAMRGTVFFDMVRQQGFSIPIGFCTGSCNDPELCQKAAQIGPVLPKIWSHADLVQLLGTLEASGCNRQGAPNNSSPPPYETPLHIEQLHETFEDSPIDEPTCDASTESLAAGHKVQADHSFSDDCSGSDVSGSDFSDGETVTRETADEEGTIDRDFGGFLQPTSPGLASETSESRRLAPRVHVACRTWGQVRKLCEAVRDGRSQIKVRAQADLQNGQDVVLALALPDEMALSMMSRVLETHATRPDGSRSFLLDLIGFGHDEMGYLLDCCAQNEEPPPPVVIEITAEPEPVAPSQNRPMPPALLQSQRGPIDSGARIPDSIESIESDEATPDYTPKISWD